MPHTNEEQGGYYGIYEHKIWFKAIMGKVSKKSMLQIETNWYNLMKEEKFLDLRKSYKLIVFLNIKNNYNTTAKKIYMDSPKKNKLELYTWLLNSMRAHKRIPT